MTGRVVAIPSRMPTARVVHARLSPALPVLALLSALLLLAVCHLARFYFAISQRPQMCGRFRVRKTVKVPKFHTAALILSIFVISAIASGEAANVVDQLRQAFLQPAPVWTMFALGKIDILALSLKTAYGGSAPNA